MSLFCIALVMTGCGTSGSTIPEIARGLPSNYAEGEIVFDARLRAKFPVGTDEKALAETLKMQGFLVSVLSDGGGATYIDRRFPVSNVWNIGWESKGGQITHVWGVYGGRGP